MPSVSSCFKTFSVVVAFFFWHGLNVSALQAVGHGQTIICGDRTFYISPEPVTTLPVDASSHEALSVSGNLVPMTVIRTTKTNFGDEELNSTIASYLSTDDVYNEDFLKAILIYSANASTLQVAVTGPYSKAVITLSESDSNLTIQNGPYILSTTTMELFVPYRLYTDSQGAFSSGVIPKADGSFFTIPAAIPGSSSMTIGVPSRLYYKPTPELPLAGVRLGVKDIYDLKGIKTGAGSRAYFDLYSEANVTALAVQRLIDAGALVIGKMKTTQFAAPEFVRHAIDYQAPFNARADGYQEVGSSSSGPGSGMGSYDWLDLAIGSDTGGSIRVPAQENSLFGNRPTHGHVDLTNVVPLGPQFDTAGLLCRDPALWKTASEILYVDLISNYTAYPKRIQTFGLKARNASDLTPSDIQIFDFIDSLSKFLSAEVTGLNYTARWIETHPANTIDDLSLYLNTTWSIICAQEQIRLVRKPFFTDYASSHSGRLPYVNPSTRGAWDWGAAQPPSLDEAISQKTTFMNWWNSEILPNDPDYCSDSLVLYVGKNALGQTGVPSYRDALGGEIGIVTGLLGGLFISPLSEVPDFVVPIGQVPYNSTVTMHEEYLPVTIDIMAAKGCDLMIMDLVNDIVAAGILSPVKTGNSILGGQIYI